MAVRALGAGQLVDAEGTWPTNYVNFAIENELAEDVAQIYTATATRMTAATIVANTLEANMWAKSNVKSNGEITWGETKKTILANTLNIVEYEKVGFANIDTKELTVDVDNNNYKDKDFDLDDVDVNSRAGLGTAKEGISYTVWYDTKEEEIVGFWVPSTTDSIEFTNVKSDGTTAKVKFVVNGKDKEYDLLASGATRVLKINGVDKTIWSDLKKGDMPLFGVAYLDENDKIEKVYAETYDKYGVVKDVTSSRITFEKVADVAGTKASTITINKDDEKDYQYFVTKDGKSIDIEDIKEEDVLFYYTKGTNNHTFVIDVYEKTVEGKVSSTNSNKVTIDGTKYDTIVSGIKAGDEGTFYFNNDGKIVMYELEEEEEGDYAVISQLRVRKPVYSDDKNLVEAKLATLDGKVTDWMSINLKKSDDSFKTATAPTAALKDSDKDANNKYLDESKVKATAVVQYEVKENKIVLKETDSTAFTGFTDAKIDYVGSKVYLNKNTKAYEVFEFESGKYELKELNIDELDTEATATGFYGEYDDKENEAELLFFTAGATNKAIANWALVLDASYDYDDDNDDTDEDSVYEVVFSDGDTKTLYADSDKIVLAIGNVYELSLDGTTIKRAYKDNHTLITGVDGDALDEKVSDTKAKLLGVSAIANLYAHEVKGNGLVTFVNVKTISGTDKGVDKSSITPGYALADDIMVISLDEDGDYEVSDFDAINMLTEDDESVALELKDFNKVISAVTYEDDDHNVEIVALVYAK